MAGKKGRKNDGGNGFRDKGGRFLPGNPGGPGNPHTSDIMKFRSALLRSVEEKDVEEVIAKLLEMAKGGNIIAIKELLDRVCGKPDQKINVSDESIDDTLRTAMRRLMQDDVIAKRVEALVLE